MTSLYFEDVEIGEEIPVFERTTGPMQWNRFAAVNDEFVFVHMDDEAGRAAGQAAAFGMGNLRGAYIMNAIRGWAGDDVEVREMEIQYRSINNKHDVLRTFGRVTEKSQADDAHVVTLEIDVINQDGKSTAPGRVLVALPSRVAAGT